MFKLKTNESLYCLYAIAEMCVCGLVDLWFCGQRYMLTQTHRFVNPPPPVFSLMQRAIKQAWYSGICKAEILFYYRFC